MIWSVRGLILISGLCDTMVQPEFCKRSSKSIELRDHGVSNLMRVVELSVDVGLVILEIFVTRFTFYHS